MADDEHRLRLLGEVILRASAWRRCRDGCSVRRGASRPELARSSLASKQPPLLAAAEGAHFAFVVGGDESRGRRALASTL